MTSTLLWSQPKTKKTPEPGTLRMPVDHTQVASIQIINSGYNKIDSFFDLHRVHRWEYLLLLQPGQRS